MSAPSNGSPEGFARFENQNGGEVEMGNGNPVGVVETGVSFKDLRNPSKDTQDFDMDEDKVKLEKYESLFIRDQITILLISHFIFLFSNFGGAW